MTWQTIFIFYFQNWSDIKICFFFFFYRPGETLKNFTPQVHQHTMADRAKMDSEVCWMQNIKEYCNSWFKSTQLFWWGGGNAHKYL
jgi:hypothetical protein